MLKTKLPESEKVDLLIVVGMFLTGFDAPTLNTLFVDKEPALSRFDADYSRTNRILDATKTFGNIVTFRDLEQAPLLMRLPCLATRTQKCGAGEELQGIHGKALPTM